MTSLSGNITYLADVDKPNNDIILRKGNQGQVIIPITSLHLNTEKDEVLKRAADFGEFEIAQQKFNYLDSLKDGASVGQLQGLEIYPLAAIGGYPAGDNIKKIRERFLNHAAGNITRTTWVKVKKGSILNPPKIYNSCFYDNGLGSEKIITKRNGSPTTVFRSFGTFIDPASKSLANENWPSTGNTIFLTKSFMQLMGFGNNTTVTAISPANVSDDFTYNLQISCGAKCSSGPFCQIQSSTGNTAEYFNGNATKNKILKGSGNSKEKIKLIVCKEWGDKLQVLLHLLKRKLDANQGSHTLLTADMPVYILCINLSIPCIFTGAHTRPTSIDTGKKWYSIMEFKPGAPKDIATTRFQNIYDSIIASNQEFIAGLTFLKNQNIPVQLARSESPVMLTHKFYDNAITDLNAITTENQKKWPEYARSKINDVYFADGNTDSDSKRNKQLTILENLMKAECTFIPFIRNCKVLAEKLTPTRTPTAKLVVLSTKYYTKILKSKDAFQVEKGKKYNALAFNQVAQMYRKMEGGGKAFSSLNRGRRRDPPSTTADEEEKIVSLNSQIEHHFPGDATEPIYYYNSLSEVKDGFPAQVDFQAELFKKFLETFKGLLGGDIIELQTYYTIFCYNSFIEGDTSCDFINGKTHAAMENYLTEPGYGKRVAEGAAVVPPEECVTALLRTTGKVRILDKTGPQALHVAGQKVHVQGGKKTKRRRNKKKKTRRKKKRRKKRTIKKRRKRRQKTRKR